MSTVLKDQAAALVERSAERLRGVSRTIHANPELGFHEVQAAALLCDELEALGFITERGICDLPHSIFRVDWFGEINRGDLCGV